MGKYAKGYIKDHAVKRTQKSSRDLLGATPTTPPMFSAENFEYNPILDQNNCGSCTGHGTAQGIFVAFGKVGKKLPFAGCPSPKDIYAVTRCLELGNPNGTLTDSGTMPSDVMVALSNWGVRGMQAPSPQGFNTDVDTSNVLDKPVLSDLEADATEILTGEYRIDETAPDFVAQVCAGVVQCGAVGIGVFVDTTFENWDPSQPPLAKVNLNDSNGGGHWICITSYYTGSDGKKVFRGPNSWSASWGDKGHFEVTEDWLKAACSDCYVFNVS